MDRSATRGAVRGSAPASSRGSYSGGTRNSGTHAATRGAVDRPGRSGGVPSARGGAPSVADRPGVRSGHSPAMGGRPSASPAAREVGRPGGYARPGRPGALPPSARPIHPAPYFYHPWHGAVVHCHPLFWDPLPLRPWYWPGFWLYCSSYWYDYHVTDVVVVREYVKETYSVDMVTFGISDNVMYAIVRDGGDTYLQVYDKDDHLLAEQKIHKKYCNLVIDAESGGCWISKKNDKDPLLFLWADGQLLIYEAD